MFVEQKIVFETGKEAVDVTSLNVGEGYSLLRPVGPYYTETGTTGIILRRIRIHETGEILVVVRESAGEQKIFTRTSRIVLPSAKDLETPRPGHYPLVPGVRP